MNKREQYEQDLADLEAEYITVSRYFKTVVDPILWRARTFAWEGGDAAMRDMLKWWRKWAMHLYEAIAEEFDSDNGRVTIEDIEELDPEWVEGQRRHAREVLGYSDPSLTASERNPGMT